MSILAAAKAASGGWLKRGYWEGVVRYTDSPTTSTSFTNVNYGGGQVVAGNAFVVILASWQSTGLDHITSASVGGVSATKRVEGGDLNNSNKRMAAVLTAKPSGWQGTVTLNFDSAPKDLIIQPVILSGFNSQVPSDTDYDGSQPSVISLARNVGSIALAIGNVPPSGYGGDSFTGDTEEFDKVVTLDSKSLSCVYVGTTTGSVTLTHVHTSSNSALAGASWLV